jgi:Cdc6-like AAA superfamily ATPase
MDKRVRSRLSLEFVEFPKYSYEETLDILKDRINYAFVKGVWTKDAIECAAKNAYKYGDIRCGLLILQKAGKTAENESSKKVHKHHVENILDKIDKYSVKGSSDLDGETRDILHIIKENGNKTILECFKAYQENKGRLCYRSFYRKVKYLELNKYVALQKVFRGRKGNTSTVRYLGL